MGLHDFETTTYRQPALAFDPIAGISVPGGPNPIVVPMIIATSGPPNKNTKITVSPLVPFVEESTNQYYGGNLVMDGAQLLPEITIDGTIDSPMTQVGDKYIPNILVNGSIRITYPELVIMCLEGRATSGYRKILPRWYRDSFGRVYGDLNNTGQVSRPRITAFTASYTEGAPQRMNFSMTLKV